MKRHSLVAAVIVFASFGASLPAFAEEKPKEEKPINVLAALADKSPDVRVDMSKRFARLIMSGDASKGTYVAGDIRSEATEKRVQAMAKAWVQKKYKDGGAGAAGVVELYFVLGDDKPAKWAASNEGLQGNLGGFQSEVLLEKLKPWTGEAGTKTDAKAAQLKAGTDVTDWVNRFLDSAASYSHEILVAGSVPRDRKLETIDGLREDNPVLGGIGQKPRLGASAGYGPDDLFYGGAKVLDLYQEGDKTRREISVKMISRKTDTGVVNEIGICDLTFPTDRFCQRFPVKAGGGDQTFALDDRKPGQRQYTLSFTPGRDGEISIKFGRPGAVAGDKEGPVIETSVSQLAQLRAQHVVGMGRLVKINGVDFYVAGQSAGSTGEHLYYRADIKDKLASGSAEDLQPEFVAVVNRRGAGEGNIVKGKIGLGAVNGKEFHTYYDAAEKRFKVGEGPGDPPPAPPSTGTGTTNPGTGTGTTNPGTGTGNQPVDPNDIEGQFLKTGYYQPNTAVNSKVKPEGLFRVHSITEKGEKWLKEEYPTDAFSRRHIIFIPGVTKKPLYVKFHFNADGYFKDAGISVILDAKYLMTVSDGGLMYFDLKGKPEEATGFPVAGRVRYDKDSKTIESVQAGDPALVEHALQELLKEADVKKALANFAAVSKTRKPEYISGPSTTLIAVYKDPPTTQFWPVITEGANTGSNFPDATGKGSTIFEGAAGGPTEPFKDKVDVGPTEKVEKLSIYNGLKKANAAFYVNAVEKGKGTKDKPRLWYIQFNFAVKAQTYRSLYIEVPLTEGGQSVAFPYAANPALDINEDGVTKLNEEQAKQDLMTTGTHGRWVGNKAGDPNKGVYAVFMTKGTPRSKKDNCLAPLFWWGMDRKAAQGACEEDSY